MLYTYTLVYVDDVPKTLAFYEKAFGLTDAFLHPAKFFGEIKMGPTKLSFVSRNIEEMYGVAPHKNNLNNAPSGMEITLVTDDVEKVYEQAIAAGATPVLAPAKQPWGGINAWVRDCNGVIVDLSSPVGEQT